MGTPLHPTLIVGVGASAGGLKAFSALLEALPANTGIALVMVSHLYPAAHSYLAEILSDYTKMPVVVASEKQRIHANHVYVIPPDADLLIETDTLRVVSPRSKANVQIDLFFSSLALAMGPRAVGIVLSGYDGDGTEGCRRIKAKGGTTFAQDVSAQVNLMPLSARASGSVDHVLPPAKIARALVRLAKKALKRGSKS